MSISTKTSDVMVLDSRLAVAPESTLLVPVSASAITYSQFPADGNYNDFRQGTIQFNNISTPNADSSLTSKTARIAYQVEVRVPSRAANAALPPLIHFPQDKYDGSYQVNATFRSWPLQKVCSNINLMINGASSSVNPQSSLAALERTMNMDFILGEAQECPSLPDDRVVLLPSKVDMVGSWTLHAWPGVATIVPVAFSNGYTGRFTSTVAYPADNTFVKVVCDQDPTLECGWFAGVDFVVDMPVPVSVLKSACSSGVMAKYEDSGDYYSRGGYKAVSFLQNQYITAAIPDGFDVWRYQISENILVSPFSTDSGEAYLANVTTMQLIMQASNLREMIVISGAVPQAQIPYDQIQVAIVDTPQLQLQFLQVPSQLKIPQTVSYGFEKVEVFEQTFTQQPLSSDQVQYFDVTLNTLRFTNMPSKLLMFARIPVANRQTTGANYSGKLTDCFLGIGQAGGLGGVSIDLDYKTGMLNTCSTRTLYRLAKENGYNSTFQTWEEQGSIVVIDVVKDIGIDVFGGKSIPGEIGNVNFKGTITLNTKPFNYVSKTSASRELLGVPAGNTDIQVVVIAIYPGTMSLAQGAATINLGDLTKQEVDVMLKKADHVTSEQAMPIIEGGGLYTHKLLHQATKKMLR